MAPDDYREILVNLAKEQGVDVQRVYSTIYKHRRGHLHDLYLARLADKQADYISVIDQYKAQPSPAVPPLILATEDRTLSTLLYQTAAAMRETTPLS